MRHFIRYYLLKILLALIIIEITILVFFQNRNHRPIANNDEFKSYSGKEVVVNILKNDTDEDDDSVFIDKFEIPASADIIRRDQKLIVKINDQFVGIDSFKYTISDGKKTAQAYLKYIIDTNYKPIGNRDEIIGYTWSPKLKFNVIANDYDNEDDSIFIQSFSQPNHGSLKLEKKFIYTPHQDFVGVDSFKYVLSDGINVTNTIPVVIKRKHIKNIIGKWVNIDVINGSFELPDDGRKYRNISMVPGWNDDNEEDDGAGREKSNKPLTDGEMAAYIASHRGGTLYQAVPDRISGKSTTYKLSFLVRVSGGLGNNKADFIASIGAYNIGDEPSTRKQIDSFKINMDGSMKEFKRYTATFKIKPNSKYAGKLLTIEFDINGPDNTWFGIDDVKLRKIIQ